MASPRFRIDSEREHRETASAYAAHRANAWWRRAVAGLTPATWALLGAALLLQSLSLLIPHVFLAWNRGHFAGWLRNIGLNAVHLAAVFVPVVLCVVATANLGPRHGMKRVAALAVAVMASVAVGMLAARAIHPLLFTRLASWEDWLGGAGYIWLEFTAIAATVTAVAGLVRRQRASVAAMHQAQIDRMALDREMAEARLQVMQAQIEPHFLFNTLANVRRLYQTDPQAGADMLDNLMRYFAVALPRMREGDGDLARERELIEAYLKVHLIRMGPRLTFDVDFPGDLDGERVPPMMLLTLVENAIKHGLNPLPDGGHIRVTAVREAGKLVLRVSDSGRGFELGEGTGGGTGLANIRARLNAQYGPAAGLSLTKNEPRGVTAQIVIPATGAEAPA
jgi:hypothetical protein